MGSCGSGVGVRWLGVVLGGVLGCSSMTGSGGGGGGAAGGAGVGGGGEGGAGGAGGGAGAGGAGGGAGAGGAGAAGGGTGGAASGIATAVSAGATEVCALVGGGVQCWGDNRDGAIDSTVSGMSEVPIRATGLASGVTAVAAGGSHGCAVVQGAAKCWGYNLEGALGDGSMTSSPSPVAVAGLGSGVTAISAGDRYSCAIVTGGGLECWGRNVAGTDGTGSSANVAILSPTPAPMLASGVTRVSAGGDHACAIMNGAAYCWGAVESGRLGSGYPVTGPGPFQVQGLTAGVTDISAGGEHSCAVVNGGAWCWGGNLFGELGNSSIPVNSGMAVSFVPVAVDGLSTGVTAIAAGSSFTCAIVNGGVQCWGINDQGQLGNNTTTDSPTPVMVHGLTTGVTAISLGQQYACALVNGSGVQCWGGNALGQLGNGTQRNSPVPVSVGLL
jgi:alpha-tubulin suppressor-like RCC1 family protein